MTTRLFTLLVLAAGLGIAAERSVLIEEIKQTERDFCAAVVKDGGGIAFPQFMAEPSVWGGEVYPDRATASAKIANRPRRPGVATYWDPFFADVSLAGDLGYAIGNSWVTGLKTPEGQPRKSEGFTFTVWRKQADGTWKFVLDAGGPSTPESVAAIVAAAKASPLDNSPDSAGHDPVQSARELRELDDGFAKAANYSTAFLEAASPHAFSLDLNAYGKAQVATALAARKITTASREPLFAETASSGDLGYSFGLWQVQTGSETTPAKGVYFTMWKRQRDGTWRWLIDNTFMAPPGPLAEKLAKFREATVILNH